MNFTIINNNTILQDDTLIWKRTFIDGIPAITIKRKGVKEVINYPLREAGYIFETWAYLLERCNSY